MQSGGALLDECLEATRFIPTIFQRTSYLLREVDAKQSRDLALLKRAQEAHLEQVLKRSKNAEDAEEIAVLADRVKEIHDRLQIRAQEKQVLVKQLQEICQTNVDRVSANCAYLEAELRRMGELEDEHEHSPPPPASASALSSHSPPPLSSPSSTTPAAAAAAASQQQLPSLDDSLTYVAANTEEDLWIKCKLVEDLGDSVIVADADPDAGAAATRYTLAKTKVVVLARREDAAAARARLAKGKTVFALYPNTTAFYSAQIVQSAYTHGDRVYVVCVFVDDEDETGTSPKRPVLAQDVFTRQ